MNSGYYAACTGLMARTEALETIANNLANVSTVGFRASHNVFSSLLATTGDSPLSVLNQDANDYGVLSGTRLDTSQGALVRRATISTWPWKDLATSRCRPLRAQFTRGEETSASRPVGQLITAAGDPVMGDNNRPITLIGAPVSISPDGTISTNGAISGRLKLVEFAPTVEIKSAGGTYYTAPAGTAVPAKNLRCARECSRAQTSTRHQRSRVDYRSA
jgi:flagellar basal-body rod protein FlgF